MYNGGGENQFIHHVDHEEGTPLSNDGNPKGGYQQYSSQDSLPDSPYSSQSLDSQATQGTGSDFCHYMNNQGQVFLSCIPVFRTLKLIIIYRWIRSIDAKSQ